MPRANKATQQKRNRERALKEKKQQKDAARAQRREAKKDRPADADGNVDPDLAGIIPGPQPPLFE